MFTVVYSLLLLFLIIYSYSQIDLNLTLSSNQLYQSIQQQLIYLGYFNRPLSTVVFTILLFLLFTFYFFILYLVNKKKVTLQKILLLVVLTCVILFFSYPAFSHDIFNYMFDARIVTKYYQNPYFHSALDFPNDLWTRFMHWTHRTYPYGPIWLILTLPFSFLGFGKFVPTLFLFKVMFALFHLGNIFLIYKILQKISPKNIILGVVFYAFNPLVIIESLVSPHNEIMMLFFLLLAIHQIVFGNKLNSFISLLLSVGIKFVTVSLLPIFLFINMKSDYLHKYILWVLFLLIPPLLIQIVYREPYSWYFLLFIGVAAILVEVRNLRYLIYGSSLAFLLRYIPFLYTGEYSSQVRQTQDTLFIFFVFLSIIFILTKTLGRRGVSRINDIMSL